MLNTYWEIELNNGEVTRLTLTFGKLYELRNKDKEAYDRYNLLMQHGTSGDLDNAVIIYTAYYCAHLDDENRYSMMEFLDLMPVDRPTINNAMDMLLAPQEKKRHLLNLFKKAQEERNGKQ